MQDSRIAPCAELLTGMGRAEGWDSGLLSHRHPSPQGNSCPLTHCTHLCPLHLFSSNSLCKFCHFLVAHCAICAVFTILFIFKLPVLYNSLGIFTFTPKCSPSLLPGCRAEHWEDLQGFLTQGEQLIALLLQTRGLLVISKLILDADLRESRRKIRFFFIKRRTILPAANIQ